MKIIYDGKEITFMVQNLIELRHFITELADLLSVPDEKREFGSIVSIDIESFTSMQYHVAQAADRVSDIEAALRGVAL